jgi:ABC-type glycerol-3-phosphate transport system substrate-binding protein
MRRRLLAAFAMVVVLASACGGQDDETADDPVPDDVDSNADVTVPDDDSAATATTTTVTIPPEATEIPDLQIVFVEFGEVGYVVIANQSDEAVDLSGIQLCQFATCADLGTVVDGGSIPAVESAEIPAATIGGFRVDGGEAALFSSADLADPEAIFAYVQWGTGGAHGETAAAARIWPSGASVEPDPAFNSIELFGDPADPESWS